MSSARLERIRRLAAWGTIGLSIVLAASAVPARDPQPDSVAGSLSDPTEPPEGLAPLVVEVAEDKTDRLDLTAIFFAADRRLAIINDRRLREGDSIGPARVVSIMPNRVRVLRDGMELELELIARDVKREPGTRPQPETRVEAPAAPAATPMPIDGGETRP